MAIQVCGNSRGGEWAQRGPLRWRWLLTALLFLGHLTIARSSDPPTAVPVFRPLAQAPGQPPGDKQPDPPKGPDAPPAPPDPGLLLPNPIPVDPFSPDQVRLRGLAGQKDKAKCCPDPNGGAPVPSPEEEKEFNRFVGAVQDPRNTLDLKVGQPRILLLKETPKRIQIGDENVANYALLGPRELSLVGRRVGSTVFNLWFTDPKDEKKEVLLSYLIRVFPDPEERERLERAYRALADEINCQFPNSHIKLALIGDKLVVSGDVHDVAEAAYIVRLVQANAPGRTLAGKAPTPGTTPAPNNATGNANDIVNLLRVVGEQQVNLKVVVAEIDRSAARSIGLNFSITNNAGITVFENITSDLIGGGTGTTGASNGAGTINGATGSATGGNLSFTLNQGKIPVALNALRTLNYARSLAEPNLVAFNGQTASFQSGGSFPIPVVTGFTGAGLQGVQFIPYGVQLNFTPYITDRDRIRLNVSAEVSTRDDSLASTVGTTGVPSLNTRNFQTTVELRDGQTLAVAGLIQNNIGGNALRVPFFGDMPFVGRLFSVDSTSAGEQELVVLITPELVHPMDPGEVPPLPGSDVWEPSDLEFYLLGRLESRRNYDDRTPARTDFLRQIQYHHCEDIYIYGPHGYTTPPPIPPK